MKSKEEINKEINKVIEDFGTVENIIGHMAEREGRTWSVHRELSCFNEFVEWFMFGNESTFWLDIEFKDEYGDVELGNCDNTAGQLLRWAALYYIYCDREEV